MASGANRVDEKAVGRLLGERLERADADFVRAKTGFAIGGVPPVGHSEAPVCFIDADLMALGEIWAAAGTRPEEHTSELQSLLRISYAVFCLTKKNTEIQPYTYSDKTTHT